MTNLSLNEILGSLGMLGTLAVLVYGVIIISKPHNFQELKEKNASSRY